MSTDYNGRCLQGEVEEVISLCSTVCKTLTSTYYTSIQCGASIQHHKNIILAILVVGFGASDFLTVVLST